MSNTNTSAGLVQDLSLTGAVLNLFNGWDLQNAQYNGVAFYVANAIPGLSNGTINNYAQVVNSVNNLLGTNHGQYPLNSTPPLGTTYFLKNVTDRIHRKLIVHESINADTNVIEDMGFGAERFSVVGIISGNNYYTVYQNMYNYFLARRGDQYFSSIPKQFQYVLTHPVRGKIPYTYLEDFQVIHAYNKYKAIVFTATFISARIENQEVDHISFANQISQALSVYVTTIGALQSVLANSQITMGNLSAQYNNVTQQQTYKNMITPNILNTTIPLANGCGTILYNNFSPTGFSNYYFQTQTIDYSALPQLIPFSQGVNLGSISSLLAVYENQIQINTTAINALNYNYNTQANDLPFSTILADVLQALKNTYVALYQLAKVYGINNQSNFNVYNVPYKMSIRMLCYLNSIDFNNSDTLNTLYQLNAGYISSVNFIPAGVPFIIPIAVVAQ